MHALRTSSMLARLILAWFVLTLGIAVASPLVQPKAMELICSDGGSTKLVFVDDSGEAEQGAHHALDCSLCLPAALPATPAHYKLALPQPSANARHPFVSAHITALLGAPLPPRGPPFLS
ncbi:DUF2946 family protein [Acidovorax sp. NCPPB 3576]|uniref:DUF2946 family protein n=1 Tax=Acidovorax sp. NCPPB 3576 TaxID=2940488 RepID=UPI002349EF48|nr:DUF2946 family protein [Acidovorax sp. NCPPB 3576]WCM86560.1 DUF2946 domain-containing protein [Acidovorax sp. NCPPB 3576]